MRIGKYDNWENLKPSDVELNKGDLVVRIDPTQYNHGVAQGDIVLVDGQHPCTMESYWAKLPHQLGDIIDTGDLKPVSYTHLTLPTILLV